MKTAIDRRRFLKGAASTGMLAVAAAAGLLRPSTVLAAWPKSAFESTRVDSALQSLFGTSGTTVTDKISILAPPIAENGAVVNVSMSTSLDNIEGIAILVEKNPNPLATHMKAVKNNIQGYLKTRIKMGKTSNVIAAVKSGGKVYVARREVKVTMGGCGG